MISRIDHIQFLVDDVDAEVEFLEKFGMKVVLRVEATHSVILRFPGQEFPYIKVLPPKANEKVGLDHVSFDLTDGAAERERLKNEGIVFEPGYEGKLVKAFNHEVSNFRDPSGILWQMTEEKN